MRVNKPKGTKKQAKKIHKTHYNQIIKTQGQGILQAESDSSQKRGPQLRLRADFSSEMSQTRREWDDIFKVTKKKKIANQEYYIQQKQPSKSRGKDFEINKS